MSAGNHTLHPDGLAAAKASAAPGLCIFCEDPLKLKPGRKRVQCGAPGCAAAYLRAWHRDARILHPERYDTGFYAAKGKRPPRRRAA